MNDEARTEPRKTELHQWHVEHGAKMVPFAGYEMPVQYPTGIIGEHLATRREAGVFDISHMGRLRIRGAAAERYLLRVLTNNARSLEKGQAQYTFIAEHGGGAVDDSYLYKLADEDYLLVVNAANRDKDWRWLHEHDASQVTLTDDSEALGMIALQGPGSETILETLIGPCALPENKRNRLSVATVDGHEVIIARTGYTGESVCFEMFPSREQVTALWERLVALGATPVGLGARDSLRLEAGLPLYGHELGRDPEGNEIPIFANSLARFAVRASTSDEYIGHEALNRQREEYIRIRRGEIEAGGERLLTRLVQPIAVFGSRRPLRAGYRVGFEGEHVGFVTSGTSVPYAQFSGVGITAAPGDKHQMRPIGLALIDSRIQYRSDRPVRLEIADDRGNRIEAELVERNLWPAAPYTRVYAGFESPALPTLANEGDLRGLAARLDEDSRRNHAWRREECINLIPSEQCTSAFVDGLCAYDPAGRYNEHNRLKALGAGAAEVRYYKGTAFIMEHEERLKAALRRLFGCRQVETRVISGQMANDIVYDALKQFRNRHRIGRTPQLLERVLVHDLNKGGHLSAQVPGALKNYVAIDAATERPAVEHFPLRDDHPYRIDVQATKALIAERRPELLVFGRSVIIHTEPVREIAEFIHAEFGRDNPARPLIMYDGAHVLGLLGAHFQDPLAEGADVVTGSTHKTFFGPQRGVILSNIEPGSAFEVLWGNIETRAFPGHVSNHHLGTLLGLLGATYEMLEFKDEYPRRVIENAKSLARGLSEHGLAVEGDPACDFTETHQVLLRGARAKGEYLASLLEANNIITNPQAFYDDPSFAAASGVRMGTQEMTRFGMGPDDLANLCALLAEIVRDGAHRPEGHWRETVERLRSRFTKMHYCFAGSER